MAGIVAEVSIARRAAELRLSSLDFGVRREEYKRLIRGGEDEGDKEPSSSKKRPNLRNESEPESSEALEQPEEAEDKPLKRKLKDTSGGNSKKSPKVAKDRQLSQSTKNRMDVE